MFGLFYAPTLAALEVLSLSTSCRARLFPLRISHPSFFLLFPPLPLLPTLLLPPTLFSFLSLSPLPDLFIACLPLTSTHLPLPFFLSPPNFSEGLNGMYSLSKGAGSDSGGGAHENNPLEGRKKTSREPLFISPTKLLFSPAAGGENIAAGLRYI